MNNNTVSLQNAKEHIHNWHEFYAEMINSLPQDEKNPRPTIVAGDKNVFRGFFVKLKDLIGIKELIEAYLKINGTNEIDPDKIGIRIYLAKDLRYKKEEENMHTLLVPVIGGKDLINLKLCINDYSCDAKQGEPESTIEGTTIFDFTTPCPSTCDKTSPLYDGAV